jgi:hypothetical protein
MDKKATGRHYSSAQLVYGEDEYVLNKCYSCIHCVVARNATYMDQNQSKHIKYVCCIANTLVMEGFLLNFDILNLSRYQLQIRTPPSHSTVVPKLIMILAIDSSFTDQNQQTYKIWDHS